MQFLDSNRFAEEKLLHKNLLSGMPGQSPGHEFLSFESMKNMRSISEDGSSPNQNPSSGLTNGDGSKGLDPQLWHACAGGMVQMPAVGSKVIYFPQGHGEQAATPPDFPRSLGPTGTVPCRVISVKFLADSETDEVYARIRLQPERTSLPGLNNIEDDEQSSPPVEKPASFAKTLTQSDANNGGGFSVPRYCAETIFPRLDYSVDPPVQTVLAKDVHGEVWKFRHIYRGTPRRHLLTTGWSTFVNHKKLVAGDAIVFLRSATGDLCVGVRRSMKGTGSGDSLSWHSGNPLASSQVQQPRPLRWDANPSESNGSDYLGTERGSSSSGVIGASGSGSGSFARNRARVSVKSVLDAAMQAASGQAFEVVYYPRASTAEFCVRAQSVKASLDHPWYPGMRFKMAFETEDSSRISWFMGTISAVQATDPILWPNSPWRILQVGWDEPDLLQGVSRVSPWQVELVSTLPMQLPPFSLPKKKFRISQPPDLGTGDAHGILGIPMGTVGGGNVLGQINPWHGHGLSDNIPAGMQGARQEKVYGLNFADLFSHNPPSSFLKDNFFPQDQPGLFIPGASESKLGSFSRYPFLGGQTDLATLMPSSSFRSFVSPAVNAQPVSLCKDTLGCTENSSNKGTTLVLFGKAIDTAQSQEQLSGGSSSEGTSQPTTHDGSPPFQNNQVDVHPVQKHLKRMLNEFETLESSTAEEIGSLKWSKEMASLLTSENRGVRETVNGTQSDDEKGFCKIFLETEELGQSLDLSLSRSYEELYDKLATMFGMEKSRLCGRVVYKDSEGSTIHLGGEPYRNFMENVSRLMILSDSTSSNSGSGS